MTTSPRRSWSRRLVMAAVGVTIATVAAEVGLRVAGVSYPSWVVFGEPMGRSLRPGATGWQRAEGEAFVSINSHGMRDREHAVQKPEGTFRIAIIGDSFAEAMQVPVEQTFWAVMEQELRAAGAFGGREIEVLNFGVMGFSTAQELIMWRTRVLQFSPDLVVLCVCTANDIVDNTRRLANPGGRPFFYFDGDDLALDDSYAIPYRGLRGTLSRIKQELKVYSRIVQLVDHVRLSSMSTGVAQRLRDDARRDPLDLNPVDLFLEPTSGEWKEAWRVTERLIETMAREVRAEQAGFVVVSMSNSIQVHPDRALREEFMAQFGIEDLFYPDHRLRELGEREGIRVIGLAERMQRYAGEHGIHLHGFANGRLGTGHWNTDGHALAGRLLAGDLLK